MTTQTKAADPAREAMTDYGRACYDTGYAQARADLIASMEAIAAVSPGGHVFAIDPDVTTAVELWQRGDRPLAIIPEK